MNIPLLQRLNGWVETALRHLSTGEQCVCGGRRASQVDPVSDFRQFSCSSRTRKWCVPLSSWNNTFRPMFVWAFVKTQGVWKKVVCWAERNFSVFTLKRVNFIFFLIQANIWFKFNVSFFLLRYLKSTVRFKGFVTFCTDVKIFKTLFLCPLHFWLLLS